MAGVSNKNHINVRKNACPQGHAYSVENTSFSKNGNNSISRKCKVCVAANKRRYYLEVRRSKIVKNLEYESHGDSGTRLYGIWGKMKQRCQNPKDSNFKAYGGRGIKVCAEWQDYRNFSAWAKLNGYSDDLTIDRKDNDKGYSPENCRWTDAKAQANNRRNNRMVTYKGITQTLQQWADEIGIQTATLRYRLNNWSNDRALIERIK